jgi:hypothetical protein
MGHLSACISLFSDEKPKAGCLIKKRGLFSWKFPRFKGIVAAMLSLPQIMVGDIMSQHM